MRGNSARLLLINMNATSVTLTKVSAKTNMAHVAISM